MSANCTIVKISWCLLILFVVLDLSNGQKLSAESAEKCKVKNITMTIIDGSCKSSQAHEISYCGGECLTLSWPIIEYPYYSDKCMCCKPTEMKTLYISLECPIIRHDGEIPMKRKEMLVPKQCECVDCMEYMARQT